MATIVYIHIWRSVKVKMYKKLLVATAVLMFVTATGNTAKMEKPAAIDKQNTINYTMPLRDEAELRASYIVYEETANERQAKETVTEVKPVAIDKHNTINYATPLRDAAELRASYIVYEKEADERQAEEAVPEEKPSAEEIFAGLYPSEDYDKTVNVLAKLLWGEARGVKSDTNKACVIWCILNRVDEKMRGDTVIECAVASHQFNYNKRFPVKESLKKIAKDVLDRWLLEKTGETKVGRVLPKRYCYFSGNGRHNIFRSQYKIHGSKKLKPIRSKVYGH